jgi:integrase/recombinase XerD
LEQLMRKYFEYRKHRGLNWRTIKSDEVRLHKFQKFLDARKLTIEQVTVTELKSYQDSLSALKPKSARQFFLTLQAFYQYCQACGYLSYDPFQDLKRERATVKEPTHLEKLLKNYLEYRKTLGLSPRTLEFDKKAILKFNDYLESRRLEFANLTPTELTGYQAYLMAHLQPTGAYKYLSILKCFYQYLYNGSQILLNPCRGLELPEYRRSLPQKILSREQIKQLMELPDLTTLYGLRDRAILELAYSSGLRSSEIVGLNLADLDLKERLLRVRGKGNKERIVPFGKTAAFYLSRYLAVRPRVPDTALFISCLKTGIGTGTLQEMVELYSGRLGFKFSFHSLRHACALHLLQNKAGIRHIQELLGHSDIRTTQVYTRLLPLDLKKAHATGHPREKEARQ